MTVRLSVAMHEHLMKVAPAPRSAYPRLSLSTLKALERRGYVTPTYRLGSMAMPHTAILWTITDAGREVLANFSKAGA